MSDYEVKSHPERVVYEAVQRYVDRTDGNGVVRHVGPMARTVLKRLAEDRLQPDLDSVQVFLRWDPAYIDDQLVVSIVGVPLPAGGE